MQGKRVHAHSTPLPRQARGRRSGHPERSRGARGNREGFLPCIVAASPDESPPPPEGGGVQDRQNNHACIPCSPSEFRAHKFEQAYKNHKNHKPAHKKSGTRPLRMPEIAGPADFVPLHPSTPFHHKNMEKDENTCKAHAPVLQPPPPFSSKGHHYAIIGYGEDRNQNDGGNEAEDKRPIQRSQKSRQREL